MSEDIIEAKSMAATAMTSYAAAAVAAAAATNTKRQDLRAKEHLEPARTANERRIAYIFWHY